MKEHQPAVRWNARQAHIVGVLAAGLVLGVGTSAIASPAAAHTAGGHIAAVAPTVPTTKEASIPLDGFVIKHVPEGVGPRESTFTYEWEDVRFASRVWETGPDKDGSYQVDLTIKTIRGDSLTDEEALRAFITEYHEQDPKSWKLESFKNGPYPGFLSSDQAFWLVEPGVAASVIIDTAQFKKPDLVATAEGFQPAEESDKSAGSARKPVNG